MQQPEVAVEVRSRVTMSRLYTDVAAATALLEPCAQSIALESTICRQADTSRVRGMGTLHGIATRHTNTEGSMTLEQLQQAIAAYRETVTTASDLEALQDMLQEETAETESQVEILMTEADEGEDEIDDEDDNWTPDPTIWTPEDIAQLKAFGLNI